MPRFGWTIVCASASIDQRTQNLTLSEIIDEIQVPLPAGVALPVSAACNWQVVTMWHRSDIDVPENFTMRLHVEQPIGTSNAIETRVDLTRHLRGRAIATIPQMVIGSDGVYEIVTSYRVDASDWLPVARTPLRVVVVPAAGGPLPR